MSDAFQRLCKIWDMTQDVPERAIPYLPDAVAHAKAAIDPCGPEGAAVFMVDLWSFFPMPNARALANWNKILGQYPGDLVKSAIDGLIASRTWDRDPPLPAHVVSVLRDEYDKRRSYHRKIAAMAVKAVRQANEKNIRYQVTQRWEKRRQSLSKEDLEFLKKSRERRERGESIASLIGFTPDEFVKPEENDDHD